MGYRHLTFCLALLAGSAAAQTVGIHTVSVHEHSGFNNINPGLYIRYDNGLTGGFYRNSYKRESAYLGYTIETRSFHNLSAAATIGGVTGYPAARVMPLVVPSIAYHFDQSAIRLGIVPRPPKTGAAAALHLMLETHIK
jgi:hypothetical protein